jgi:hypothetical protein
MVWRVFVSHANGDKQADQLVDELAKRLRDANHQVLVDVECLAPGQPWRKEIYTWLSICGAAIVLFSDKVFADDKIWVARETMVLKWREAIDPSLCLIGIRFPGVDRNRLESSERFRDLLLDESQYLDWAENTETIVDKVLEALRAKHARESPLDGMAGHIARRLKLVDEDYFDICAANIDIDLLGWHHANRAHTVALKLLSLGLGDLYGQLRNLLKYAVTPHARDAVSEIKSLLGSCIFPLESARWLAIESRRPTPSVPRRALVLSISNDEQDEGLHNEHRELVRLYVCRTTCCPPDDSWQVLMPTMITGDYAEDAIAEELATLCDLEMPVQRETPSSRQKDELLSVLIELAKNDTYVVVMMSNSEANNQMFLHLREKYWPLMFVMVSCSTHDVIEDKSNFQTVTPRLIDYKLVRTQLLALNTLFRTKG